MTSITTRAAKGSPLTHNEVDANFTNLNNDKLDTAGIALGSAAAPSLAFTSDPNTGIFSPGADQVAISTNGSERLRIRSDGMFEVKGAGTAGSSPAFSVNGSAPANSVVIDSNGDLLSGLTGNLGYGGRNIILKSGQGYAGIAALATESRFFNTFDTTAIPITFFQGGVERMRIDSSGRLGIGTSSPSVNFHIAAAVSDPILFSNTNGSAYNSAIWQNNNNYKLAVGIGGGTVGGDVQDVGFIGTISNIPLSFQTNNTTRMRITAAGLVGIGTTSPQNILHLAGSSPQLILDPGSGSTDPVSINSWRTNSPITFRPGDTERARIDGSGRLLVGTSTALDTDLLQTFGNLGLIKTTVANQLNFHGTGIEFVNRNSTARAMNFYVGASGGAPVASLSSAGVWTNASDVKNKENIEDISYGIETVKSLIPRQFDIKSNGKHAIGFIAQEVQFVIPELISKTFIEATQETHLGLDYGSLTAVLTKALQEVLGEIDVLKAKVAALESA